MSALATGQFNPAREVSESVTLQTSRDAIRIILRGDVGCASAQGFLDTAQQASTYNLPLEIDLSAVDHIDTSTLQILLALRAAQNDAGQPFLMLGVPQALMEYFALAGWAQLPLAQDRS